MMRLNLLPDYKFLMNLPSDKIDQGEYVDPQIAIIRPRMCRYADRARAVIILKSSWLYLQVIGTTNLSEYDLKKVKGHAVTIEN